MANLIKNGDFSKGGDDWTATHPENVSYVTGHCIVGIPGAISQDVPTGGVGGEFMFSARVKTIPGAAARIIVQPHPTGERVQLLAAGDQEWTVLSQKFSVQISTISFTVTLEAADGAFGTLGTYFGDVTLSKLL